MIDDDINVYVPSVLNPRSRRKNSGEFTLTQNSVISRCSLSLRRSGPVQAKALKKTSLPVQSKLKPLPPPKNKENCLNSINNVQKPPSIRSTRILSPIKLIEDQPESIGLSAVEDIASKNGRNTNSTSFSYGDFVDLLPTPKNNDIQFTKNNDIEIITILSLSSATELDNKSVSVNSDKTTLYDLNDIPPNLAISFGILNCDNVDVSTRNLLIKNIQFSHNNNNISVDCEIKESSQVPSTESECSQKMNKTTSSQKRKSTVAVNLEIKKKKPLTDEDDNKEKNKVLILKTDAIDKLSHVIVQPPNYKLVKRQINTNNLKNCEPLEHGRRKGNLKQIKLDKYFQKNPNVDSLLDSSVSQLELTTTTNDVNNVEMIKNPNNNDGFRLRCNTGRSYQSSKNELSPQLSPRSYKLNSVRDVSHQSSPSSVRKSDLRTLSYDGPRASSSKSPRGSLSPKKNAESLQFPIPTPRLPSNKTSSSVKAIPHFKIVAGTHFAVDAFSYGDIPNVQHYFLTHFHSDHYSGLRKSFSKSLYCSKITAELCTSRLGVNMKNITIVNIDDTMKIDGVEITAVDANHCPGALMLIFTLPNGKSILHTGDFRAFPAMESFPVFWNKDIHTIYLDTTYCNPRYDFPTQEESLEMALYLLRQKKMALEKAGKKFSQVLIVCGTYTIGKEKFFLGMARRVGCSVWACPEKDRVLRVVENRSFGHAAPHACQLHVVPMRDLAVDKLRQYLASLNGTFTEVVAFKPSGWENGKNSAIEGDKVTIYGIPYSEHSSFSEMIRFVKYLQPKQVVPTVDITGGIKAVQKFFPCPLVLKEGAAQSRVTEYFSLQAKQQPAVT